MSPTKQVRGDSGKDHKLHQVAEWRKNLPGSVLGASSPLANKQTLVLLFRLFVSDYIVLPIWDLSDYVPAAPEEGWVWSGNEGNLLYTL